MMSLFILQQSSVTVKTRDSVHRLRSEKVSFSRGTALGKCSTLGYFFSLSPEYFNTKSGIVD